MIERALLIAAAAVLLAFAGNSIREVVVTRMTPVVEAMGIDKQPDILGGVTTQDCRNEKCKESK